MAINSLQGDLNFFAWIILIVGIMAKCTADEAIDRAWPVQEKTKQGVTSEGNKN